MFQLQSIDHCGHGIWVLIGSLPNPGVVDLRRAGILKVPTPSLSSPFCLQFVLSFFFFGVSQDILFLSTI